MNKKNLLIGVSITSFISIIFLFVFYKNFINTEIINTLMGNFTISKGIITEAISNKAMQRMKLVDQGGPGAYFDRAPYFARYDHCLGVWGLLKRFGASEKEQLVGLWHDISHTAFSHVADVIFHGTEQHHSYQDKIHLWYLSHSPAEDIIKSYNLALDQLDPDNGTYKMLEQDLPDMCADRIEYNLHTAFIYQMLTKDDINEILKHLHFGFIEYEENRIPKKEQKWYFDDIVSAKKFALLPIYFMKTIWNCPTNVVTYKFFSELIRYAFQENYLSKDMFHFGSDQDVLKILENNEDITIKQFLKRIRNIENTFSVLPQEAKSYDDIFHCKFRGIDPLVKEKNSNIAKRLSKIDQNFEYLYTTTKDETTQPIKIKYHTL